MTGLVLMRKRLLTRGETRLERIVNRKYKSFLYGLDNSYQAETITLLDSEGNLTDNKWKCLINASRLTEQFDKKVISIDFDAGLKEGDVFYWDRTKLYWFVNLQQHTEEAYFRATITRAEFEIEIEGKHYWAILSGPDETTTDWKQKHQIWFNNLNYSMSIEIAKNSSTVRYFTRNKVIKMKETYPDINTGEEIEELHRWQVVATDKYSSDKIIQVYLKEYFDNEMEDAMIAEKPQQEDSNTLLPHIVGSAIVYPYDESLGYTIEGLSGGVWSIDNPKKAEIIEQTDEMCVIDVLASKKDNFILKYKTADNEVILNIKVNSL